MTTLVEHPVYFVSTVLRDPRERYPMQQKLLFSLLSASRKLRHYFQGPKMSNNLKRDEASKTAQNDTKQ